MKMLMPIKNGSPTDYHGSWHYMENKYAAPRRNSFPKPNLLSSLSATTNNPFSPFGKGAAVASYARGHDYHHVHRKRLKNLSSGWKNAPAGKISPKASATPRLSSKKPLQCRPDWVVRQKLPPDTPAFRHIHPPFRDPYNPRSAPHPTTPRHPPPQMRVLHALPRRLPDTSP